MKEKKSKSYKLFKNGTYSIGITAVVLAIIVIINMVAGNLPSKFTKFDLSITKLYTLTDVSKKVLSNLDEDITIYVIAETGQEDASIMELLNNYKSASSHIKVKKVDPVLHPTFLDNYDVDLTTGSVLVESSKRYKGVDSYDLYVYEYNSENEAELTGFDAEGQITSAIDYVTTDNLPVVYQVQGHGETEFNSNLVPEVSKQNIDLQSLSLLTADIPDDAAGIIINAPTSDFSAEEAQKVIAYLEKGGDAMIVTNYKATDMTNFNTILDNYGVKVDSQVIIEGDMNAYSQTPSNLVPTKQVHDITQSLIDSSLYVLFPLSQGIEQLDNVRSSIEFTPLLETSNQSYSKDVDSSDTMEKILGDKEGPFTVGALITETYNDVETKIALYTSSFLTNANIDQYVSGGNTKLIISSLSYISGQESDISIPVKSTKPASLVINEGDIVMWGTVTQFVIPIAVALFGLVVWLRRRKR